MRTAYYVDAASAAPSLATIHLSSAAKRCFVSYFDFRHAITTWLYF